VTGSNIDGAYAIIRSGTTDRADLAGYWRQQFSGNGNVDLDEASLGCLLQVVDAMSTVFDEERDVSSMTSCTRSAPTRPEGSRIVSGRLGLLER